MALQHCSTELSDTLGTDASTGPAVWRVVALSTLSSVLTSLGPSRDQQSSKIRGDVKFYFDVEDMALNLNLDLDSKFSQHFSRYCHNFSI